MHYTYITEDILKLIFVISVLPSNPLPSKVPPINTIGCWDFSGHRATSHSIYISNGTGFSQTVFLLKKLDRTLPTFSFQDQYSQLGISFFEQMSCTQSRQSSANNNYVPNFCCHTKAQVFFYAKSACASSQ